MRILPKVWVGVAVCAVTVNANAARREICTPAEGVYGTAECITEEMFANALLRAENKTVGVRWRRAEIGALLDNMRAQAGATDDYMALVIREDYSLHARYMWPVNLSRNDGVFLRAMSTPLLPMTEYDYQFRKEVRDMMYDSGGFNFPGLPGSSIPGFGSDPFSPGLPGLPGFGSPLLRSQTNSEDYSSWPTVSREIGWNTYNQKLFGPPGSGADWGCTGYESIDSCKACCMATRTSLLGSILAAAVKCHASANACASFFGIGAAACHIACGIVETAALAATLYSMNHCNGNCERHYYIDTGISWNRWSGSAKHALYWDSVGECEGWYSGNHDVFELNGGEFISIPGAKLTKHARPTVSRYEVDCVVLNDSAAKEHMPYNMKVKVLGEIVECPDNLYDRVDKPYGHYIVEANHDGITCIDGDDFRVIDGQYWIEGAQVPVVGILEMDEDNELFMEKVDGTLMTLDFINNDEESLAWFLGLMRDWFGFELKVALFGEQSGDHMRVESYRDLIFVSAEDG